MKAERAGFEPAIPLRVYKLSRLARSATLTPLRIVIKLPLVLALGVANVIILCGSWKVSLLFPHIFGFLWLVRLFCA
ncbi:MAG: hypothetical protein JWO09_1543 [Bacteroidetes bacterium]|nr:hypothetical protein [Bacteroidota bacterium]